jgi:hypothetical protein
MPLTLTMDEVYLRAGRVEKAFPVAGQLRPARPLDKLAEFGLLVHWPRDQDWLRVTARSLPAPGAGGMPVPFADTLPGLDAVCARHQVARNQLAPPLFLEQNAYLAASLPSANQVELVVAIDTDAPGFRAAVDARRDPTTGHVVLPVSLRYFDGRQFGSYVDQGSRLDVSCKPCRPLPRFVGVMAIDLGNAVSSVAALAESARVYESAAVQLISLDRGGADPRLLASAVRLDEVRTPRGRGVGGARRLPSLPSDDEANAVRYVVGRAALAAGAGPAESTVLGVKQLLSVPEPAAGGTAAAPPHFSLNVPHSLGDGGPPQTEQMEVLNHFPGELVFAHAFNAFRAEQKSWPADVVLTYPTTYTRGELRQLVTAAVRGWLRAVQQPQNPETDVTPTDDTDLDMLVGQCRGWLANPERKASECPLVRLTLDEATAAAFFHVHRRVFERPGALARFRYLRPRGTHALVIDCGGGTTDVVLARASAPEPRTLKLDVLARTGLRNFGGDDITAAVCRVAKAKFALLLARVLQPAAAAGLNPPPAAAPPGDPLAAVRKFLDRAAELRAPGGGEFVPTKFDPRDLSADSLARQAAARALWQIGEEIKRKLAEGKPVKFNTLTPALLHKETSALMRLVLEGKPPAAAGQIAQQLGELAVAPWEVDALVRGQVEAVVTKCNALIADKLPADAAGDVPEVDWVVLSGNGARYPLVQKLLREKLRVAFLDSPDGDRFTFDSDNLKHAVAKGAALARLTSRVARTASVQYESALSERLPFEVGLYEMHSGGHRVIFREFTPYEQLLGRPREVEMASARADRPETVVLERRFPGDREWSQFAAYAFPDGLPGPAKIEYDDERGRFVVTSGGSESAFTDLTNPLDYVSPQTRGDL